MATQLERANFSTCMDLQKADIYIVNTCAVTNIAERKSRQTIAKINKINEKAKIVICGCASQRDVKQFCDYPSVIAVIGNHGKENIVDIINECKKEIFEIPCQYANMQFAKNIRVRQFIKIQDGCNNFCTYCIIPYLRGRSRSRDLNDILTEIKQSKASEIVLTGIDMSDYRIDNKLALTELVKQVDKLNVRFRISSLEVNVVTDEFLDTLIKCKNFCPHFHLSLQSACDETLKRMNRKYKFDKFKHVVSQIKNKFPFACISTDIIVGFVQESDVEFQTTYDNIESLPFSYMHIFPYSERQGTAASKMSGKVSKDVAQNRVKKLTALAEQKTNAFLKANIDTEHTVLVEAHKDKKSYGYTENYIYVEINDIIDIGKVCKVKIKDINQKSMIAEII